MSVSEPQRWRNAPPPPRCENRKVIQLRNVTLRRGAKVLLDGVSVTINPGEKVGLVGRNGAGKSTLFALLNGSLHEDAGDFSLPAQWRLAQVAQHMPETGEPATAFVVAGDTRLAELRTTLDDMPARIAALLEERKKLERDLSDARKKLAMGAGGAASGDGGASDIRTIGDVKFLGRAVQGIEIKDLKSLADQGKKQLGSGVVALVATSEDGKASVVVGVTQDLTARFNAVDLVRKASEVLGGKGGGGKPDMAQAGGPAGTQAAAALEAVAAAMGA